MPNAPESARGAGRPGGARSRAIPSDLVDRYARKLPGKLALLRDLLEELRADPTSSDIAAEARRAAHQLRGTAGSFGFPAVSEQAGHIEDLLRAAETPGGGSLCWERLDEAIAAAERCIPRLGDPPTGAAITSWKARILLVDDDPDFVDIAQALGRRQLIDVVGARDVDTALRRARGERFDGAIIDVWLDPDLSTFDLAARLRAVPGNDSLPIAFTSADEASGNRIAAAHAGAALFLTKPLTESRLDEAVDQLVSLRRASEPDILVMDDDADFFAHAQAALAALGFHVRTIADTEDVLVALEQIDPEALLLDAMMPNLHGLDVCRILRTTARWQDLPIIVVTADDSATTRVEAFAAGCDDCIVKPVSDEELRVRVKARVDRRRMLQARLERDPLTGLSLRRRFIERLRSRISEAHRRGQSLALCLLDLDRFKRVNDTYGHLAGDRVLANVGHLISARFRSEDLRSRWGGEEFALAFPGEDAGTARSLIEELLTELSRVEFTGDRGEAFEASFSAGIAEFPADGNSMEMLFRAADERLYRAKAAGRRCVVSDSAPRRRTR